jgi:CheY-like chemotaxis protein
MATQPRILMVEDHPDIADLYQLKLQLEGYRVAVAHDGRAGLDLARSLNPDLMLLDIHLPQLDGLQVLASLREDDATRDLLVVVFTEDDSQQVMQEALRLSAAAVLVKAHSLPSTLSQTVSQVLRHRSVRTATGASPAERAS